MARSKPDEGVDDSPGFMGSPLPDASNGVGFMDTYPARTRVYHVEDLVNMLVVGSGDASYSEILEKLPMLLPLAPPFTDVLRRVPLLVASRKVSGTTGGVERWVRHMDS